jgi:hypothetical protein
MDEYICKIDCMIVAGKDWSTQRKSCPRAALSVTNLIQTGLEWNPGLCGKMPAKKLPQP